MKAKKVLVTAKNSLPAKKLNVNKEWMLQWLTKYGTLQDVEWYEKICKENVCTFQSNLNGQTYDVPDWAKVRAAFLKRFFPDAYPKTPPAKKAQATYEDRLAALKAAKAKEQDQMEISEPRSKKK